jgi:hypothetical protein
MKLQPLNDKIVIKREEAEEKTSSGLYLPSGAQEKPRKGKVIALGQGKYLENGKRSTFFIVPKFLRRTRRISFSAALRRACCSRSVSATPEFASIPRSRMSSSTSAGAASGMSPSS